MCGSILRVSDRLPIAAVLERCFGMRSSVPYDPRYGEVLLDLLLSLMQAEGIDVSDDHMIMPSKYASVCQGCNQVEIPICTLVPVLAQTLVSPTDTAHTTLTLAHTPSNRRLQHQVRV